MGLEGRRLAAVQAVIPRLKQWSAAWGVPTVGLWCPVMANAWAESGFDPLAAGDSGWSIGLWQCNRRAGLGRGYTVAQLQDPVFNLDVVANEAQRLGFPAKLRAGMTIATAAAWWCAAVERPSDIPGQSRARAAYADAFARQLGHTGSTLVKLAT